MLAGPTSAMARHVAFENKQPLLSFRGSQDLVTGAHVLVALAVALQSWCLRQRAITAISLVVTPIRFAFFFQPGNHADQLGNHEQLCGL